MDGYLITSFARLGFGDRQYLDLDYYLDLDLDRFRLY